MFCTVYFARYATNMIFSQICRSSGSVAEEKGYFPEKHKLYTYKAEMSVLSLKLAFGCTEHYPGSLADLEIFRQNSPFHNESSKMYVQALHHDDTVLFVHHESKFWAVFAHKSYQGASELLRVVQPIPVPIHEKLAASQLDFY